MLETLAYPIFELGPHLLKKSSQIWSKMNQNSLLFSLRSRDRPAWGFLIEFDGFSIIFAKKSILRLPPGISRAKIQRGIDLRHLENDWSTPDESTGKKFNQKMIFSKKCQLWFWSVRNNLWSHCSYSLVPWTGKSNFRKVKFLYSELTWPFAIIFGI